MVISFVVNNLSETILDLYPRRQAFYQPLHIGVSPPTSPPPPGSEHLPIKAVSRSVVPCQVSYSLNSDLGTEYLIAEMLYIE